MKKIIFLTLIGLLIVLPTQAKIGVGVGLGKIQIDEPLKPGGIYKLPNLPVLNTGDEAGDYEVAVTYQHEQPQQRPAESWFTFSPKTFYLEGGQSKIVEMTLTIPTKVTPGDYFAYLEAHPVAKKEGVTIGVAAATKIYFTVKAGTVLGAFTERVKSLMTTYSPISFIILGILTLIILIFLFRKFFRVRFKIEKKKKS